MAVANDHPVAESEIYIRFEIFFKLELGLIRQRLGKTLTTLINTCYNFDKSNFYKSI